MGTLSLGYAEKLIMGVGAKAALLAGLVFAAAGLLFFTRAPVDGNLGRRHPAGDVPARHRRGARVPGR